VCSSDLFSYLQEKLEFIAKASNSIMAASPLLQKTLQDDFEQYHLGYSVDHFFPYTDTTKIRLSEEVGKPRLICVNAITERKNQMELLEAANQLRSDHIEVELVFTGYTANEAYYQCMLEYIQVHHLESQVAFESEGLDNWSQIRKSDIFVNNSKMETFSLTMIEGLKLGLPMIVANNEATQSMAKLGYFDETSIYESGDLRILTEKIKYFLDNFEERQQLSVIMAEKVLSEQSLENCSRSLVSELERIKDEVNPLSELTTLSAYFQNGLEHFRRVESELIPDLHRIIDDKNHALTDLAVNGQKALHDKEVYIQERDAENAQIRQRLEKIQNSRSYKLARILALPLKKLRSLSHK
jgi:glycosyltransferase involved in cell wall biosynthesis